MFSTDPSQWLVADVHQWLQWAVDNFNLEGIDTSQFQYTGLDLLRQGRDRFLLRAPPYVGDILWEHLDILQKGQTATQFPNSYYRKLCRPSHDIF